MNIEHLLIGFAIGDAFGAGIEFQDKDWIKAHVDFSTFVNARNQIRIAPERLSLFTENYTPWDYTDDTEMTIGSFKAIVSGEPFTEQLLIEKWKAEYDKGILEKGYGRNGHGSMRWFYTGEKTLEEIRSFQRNRPNPGNAPAMRAIPIGLVPESKINAYAEINANATHPNENAIISSQIIARATEYLLIKTGDPKNIIDYCFQKVTLNKEYSTYLKQVNALDFEQDLSAGSLVVLCGEQPIQKPYFLPGITGLPSDSKYTAGGVLYILKHHTDPFKALQYAIRIGGDVDSIASISTGIIASRFGIHSLPKFMLDDIEGLQYLKILSKKFDAKLKNL